MRPVERARASAEQRLERIAAAQALLADTSRQLGPAVDLDTTVKTVLLAMRALVAFRGGSICLVEHDGIRVARGVFGADMQVASVGDGPITLILDSP